MGWLGHCNVLTGHCEVARDELVKMFSVAVMMTGEVIPRRTTLWHHSTMMVWMANVITALGADYRTTVSVSVCLGKHTSMFILYNVLCGVAEIRPVVAEIKPLLLSY